MKKPSVRMIVEGGILIAIAQVLSYVKIFEAPYGGSITAGSMVPIVLFAVRWGLKPGLLVGTVYGLLQFILGGEIFSLHPMSILLDYLLAFGLLGLAGLFRGSLGGLAAGTTLGVFGRFVCHYLSGVIVWGMYAPEGMSPYYYSLVYNGAYMLPELIITVVIIGILYKALEKRGIIQNMA